MLKRVVDLCTKVLPTAVIIPRDDTDLMKWCEDHGMTWLAPDCDEDNLVERYRRASSNLTGFIRVTSDCPVIPIPILKLAKERLEVADYVSNTMIRTHPDGCDVQAVKTKAYEWICENTEDREHPFKQFDENQLIRDKFVNAGFSFCHIYDPNSPIFQKFSVDTEEDLKRVENVIHQAKSD